MFDENLRQDRNKLPDYFSRSLMIIEAGDVIGMAMLQKKYKLRSVLWH